LAVQRSVGGIIPRVNLRIAAAVILLVPAASGAATGGSGGAEALIRVEERWIDALQRRDAAVVAEILADDFLDSTYKGELRTKGEALAGLRSPSRADTDQRLSEMRARTWGAAGVVTGINTVTARDGSFSVRVRFTDVFVRRGGVWKAVSAQETLVEGTR
jgi:ketosteroid isomerase-like protein